MWVWEEKLSQNECSNIISLWKRRVLFRQFIFVKKNKIGQFMGQPWFTKEKIGICTKIKAIEK